MFGFITKAFDAAMTFLIPNVLNVNSLECVSMNNQECKARSEMIVSRIMSLCFILTVLK